MIFFKTKAHPHQGAWWAVEERGYKVLDLLDQGFIDETYLHKQIRDLYKKDAHEIP